MLRISLCLVFLRNSNSNPRTLGVIHTWIHRLLRWPCWITWLLAVFSVYAGSRVEILDRLELKQTASFSVVFFFFSLLFLTASCWQNDDGISWDMNGWKRNGRRLQPWQRVTLSRGRMLMKAGPYSETSLLSRCGPAWPHVNDVASPAPQILPKISCCQVFVSFICEYHISMLYP